MTMFKTIIQNLKKYIKISNDDLSFLNVGDIVWAKRYSSLEEKNKIKKGHRESPYVVISKEKGTTLALQCTSNPHSNIKWKDIYYVLNRFTYKLDKNCYVNTTASYVLTDNQYVRKIGHLTDYDLNKLKKYLYIIINSEHRYKPDLNLKKLNFNYEIGDIILYEDEKYYIYDMDDINYLTYRLSKKLKHKNRMLINNTYYSFVFSKIVEIKKKSEINLVETFNTSEIELINSFKEEQIKRRMNKNSLVEVGSLIEYNENYYYVADISEEHFIVYRIYTSQSKTSNMALLKIDDGHFYTHFGKVKLSKRKSYKIRRKASDKEIEYNKSIFNFSKIERTSEKRQIHKTKGNSQKRDISAFIPKTIIVDEEKNKYYLILSRKGDIVELVNINNLSDYFYFHLKDDICPYEFYRMIPEEDYIEYKRKIKELQELAKLITKDK